MNETCAQCRYFRPQPPNPAALGQPPQGECWHGPPAPVAILTPQGVQIVLRVAFQAAMPKCGQFQPKPLELAS